MKKKIVILVILLFIISIGIYAYTIYLENRPLRIGEVSKFEPLKNYTIREVSDGKIVENRKKGFSIKIPLEWTAQPKDYYDEEYGIEIYSPNIEIDQQMSLPQKGCLISISIYYNKMEYEDWIEKIENPTQKENYKVIEISSKKGIEILFLNNKNYGKGYFMNIPFKDRIYAINRVFAPDSESLKNCPEQVDKILQTVSIN